MIDRRDMLKLVAAGFVGAVVAGHIPVAPVQGPAAAHESLRFTVEGDVGPIRATSGDESIVVDGHFAETTRFALQ